MPLRFDPERLRSDLAAIDPGEWVPHFNTGGYEGDWSGVALRAVDGDAHAIYPDPTATDRYGDTLVLSRVPYLREVLAEFRCRLTSVRLLKLCAGSEILEHRDHRLSAQHGEARIHVPIVTNERVVFFLGGEPVPMAAGEAWYLDLELPHRVTNLSDEDRVHLVIDCIVDEWLAAMLQGAEALPADDPREADEVGGVESAVGLVAVFDDPLVATIVDFIRAVGLEVVAGELPAGTALPGITVCRGRLVVDASALCHPGDLLHEAGHLAVVEPARRGKVSGSAGTDGAEEMMAIAWSYAATVRMGIEPSVVFHADGYRGGSQSLLEQFAQGRYLAVPMLQWLGLAYDDVHAAACDARPYPAMRRWLRTHEAPDPPAQ